MRRTVVGSLLVSFLFLLLPRAWGAELHGVVLPDVVERSGQTLALNGLGARKATIFRIKVYVAGLYLSRTSHDARAILDSPDLKQLVLHFVRDVSKDDIVEAWNEGFERNVKDARLFAPQLAAVTAIAGDMKAGEEMRITFEGDSATLELPDGKSTSSSAPGFARALLSIWLGEAPPNQDLREGLLGNS